MAETIILLEGKVGGGKSYRACKKYAVPHLALGGVLGHNLPLRIPGLKKLLKRRFDWDLQDGQLIDLHDKMEGFQKYTPVGSPDLPCMVIWDESQGKLNARAFNTDYDSWKKEFFAWLCTARHDYMVVIFVTQHAANVDAQIKRLVLKTELCMDMWKWKAPYLRIPSPINGFMIKEFNGVHEDGECVDISIEWKDSDYYEVYDSYSRDQDFKRAQVQNRFDKGRVVMKKEWKRLVYGIAVLVAVCGWQSWRLTQAQSKMLEGMLVLQKELRASPRSTVSDPAPAAAPVVAGLAGVGGDGAPARPDPAVARRPGIEYVPVRFNGFVDRASDLTVFANGHEYRRGARVGDSIVVTVSEDRVLLRRRDGNFVLLYPADLGDANVARVAGADEKWNRGPGSASPGERGSAPSPEAKGL